MGPGGHLLKLTEELGIRHPRRGGPVRHARWMDKIGVLGCRREFDQIAARIQENAKAWNWLFVDKVPGLLKSAIDRAEQNGAADKPFWSQWVDPLVIWDRRMQQTAALRDILAGRSIFLVGGGPSANSLPLEQLNRRGCWTFTINNVGAHQRFRPQAFTCTDPPEKFHDAIWLDPAIMKFCPDAKLEGGRAALRTKLPDGTIVPLERNGERLYTRDCPNVWGVKRRKWMLCDDTFFTDDSAPNGNYSQGVEMTGERKTICTMIFAIRILRHLGARRVFLIGVDFRMDPSKAPDQNYSFGELRDEGACRSNNSQYVIVNDWLMRLEANGVFAKFGMNLYNCNQHSALRAFPYVPFEQALELVCEGVEKSPDCANWYIKSPKNKRK